MSNLLAINNNPKYVQEYLKKHEKFPIHWNEEEKQNYIEHAEFYVIDKIIMFDDKYTIVLQVISSLFGTIATLLILSKVLPELLK